MPKKKLKKTKPYLDLHGLTQDDAFYQLTEFLEDCYNKGVKKCLVITGKSGILKENVPRWMNSNPVMSDYIVSIGLAEPHDGGVGAYYVGIKKESY